MQASFLYAPLIDTFTPFGGIGDIDRPLRRNCLHLKSLSVMIPARLEPQTAHCRGCTMVDARHLITVDELATEIKKQHHDSDLMRMLLADLRERRVDLNEFCQRVKMLIGEPALVVIVLGLRVKRSLKKAQLVQEREHQLASPVGSGSIAPAGGPTPPSTASTTAADASPAAAPPAAASPAAASPAAALPAAAGGYADHAEVHSLSSLKRKVEVLQQANQRLDAENAVIKQKLAGKRVLLDSSAYATQRMLFKRMLLKRVLLERYDRA